MIDLRANPPQSSATRVLFCLECQPHSDNFQRICDEDARHARQTPRGKPSEMGFLLRACDEERAHLLVSEELDGGVREDFKEGGRVPAEEAASAVLQVDVPHGCHHAEPAASVFGELRGGGLKEDFHAVEGGNCCFGLCVNSIRLAFS